MKTLTTRRVQTCRKLNIFDVDGHPTGEVVKSGQKGRVYGYAPSSDYKWTVLFDDGRSFMIVKKWLQPISSNTLSVEELAFNLLWELCSGSWQHILKENDTGGARIAERIKEIVEMKNQPTKQS